MMRIIFGAEPYLIKKEKDMLKASVGEMSYAQFSELNENVWNCCQQYPIFSKTQGLCVELEKLPTDEAFLKQVTKVPEFTTLLITVSSMDKRTSNYKRLLKGGYITEYKKVSKQELIAFIKEIVQEEQAVMPDKVLQLFLTRIGYESDDTVNLFSVANAVRQLSLSGNITEADVTALVPYSPNAKSWYLTNALLEQDAKRLFEMTDTLLTEKESPIAMLSLILRAFRLAYKASLCKGHSDKEIEAILGVPVYQFKAALKYSPAVIERGMELILQAVSDIKAGTAEASVILRICLAQTLQALAGASS